MAQLAVTATEIAPMSLGELRSALLQAVHQMIQSCPRLPGGLLDLTGVHLYSDTTTFILETEVASPPSPLAPMTQGAFTAQCTTTLNHLLNAIPKVAGKLDLTEVRISYYTNNLVVVETGIPVVNI